MRNIPVLSRPILPAMLLGAGLAGSALADNTVSGRVAPGSRPMTSWLVRCENSSATVTAPPNWTADRLDGFNGQYWHVQAVGNNNTQPGQTIDFTIHDQHNTRPRGSVVGADYTDTTGTHWQTLGGDPLGMHTVHAGPSGASYLGYAIPANQWGYFYQQWQTPDAKTTLMSTRITVGADSGAFNFQVLANSFAATPRAGFDLMDVQVPLLDQPSDQPWETRAYMDPADATGLPGSSTSWAFNAATGVATLDYSAIGGLRAGMTSCIVAYTSRFEPTLPSDFQDSSNLSYTYANAGGCPFANINFNTALVPIPTPGTGALLGLGALCLAPRRRR